MTTDQENYTAWFAAEIQASIDDPRPSIPHDQVMAEMDADIAALPKDQNSGSGSNLAENSKLGVCAS